MGLMAKIVCKTAGAAGMSAVLYDAYTRGKKQSARTALNVSADTFESVIADTRTVSTASPTTVAIQKKVADFRMSNPIRPFIGRITGFIKGALDSITDSVIPVVCSCLALAGKGRWAKAGAWGILGYGIFTVLREGFGVGKENSIGK